MFTKWFPALSAMTAKPGETDIEPVRVPGYTGSRVKLFHTRNLMRDGDIVGDFVYSSPKDGYTGTLVFAGLFFGSEDISDGWNGLHLPYPIASVWAPNNSIMSGCTFTSSGTGTLTTSKEPEDSDQAALTYYSDGWGGLTSPSKSRLMFEGKLVEEEDDVFMSSYSTPGILIKSPHASMINKSAATSGIAVAYSETEVKAKMADAELSLRETMGKRGLIGMEEIYSSVKEGYQGLPAGYFALKVLVESMMPFVDPISAKHMSDVLAGWRREVKNLESEQAVEAQRQKEIEPEILSEDQW